MALTLATELANYAAGIGTQGATLKIDSANKRVGVGTTNPQGPEGSLQVGTGITFFGNTGIISAIGGKFSGDFTVGGTLTYEDVQNVNSSGVGTFSGGINVVGGGLTVTGLTTIFGGSDTGNILQISGADSTSETLEAGITSGHVQFTATHASGGSNACGFIFRTRGGAGGTNEKLRITSAGNVGIGTNNPGKLVELAQTNSTAYSATDFDKDYHVLKLRNYTNDKSVGMQFLIGGNGEAAITAHEEDADGSTTLAFGVRNSGSRAERMRIDSSGNVGFGTTSNLLANSTRRTLSLNHTGSSAVAFGVNGTREGHIYVDNDEMEISAVDNFMYFTAGNSERMRIFSGGQVAIATATNYGNANCDDLIVGNRNNNEQGITIGAKNQGQIAFADLAGDRQGLIHYQHTDDSMRFMTSGASNERMRIRSDGLVGIATAVPEAQLTVKGDGDIGAEDFKYLYSNTHGLQIKGAESALDIVSTDDGSHGGSILLRSSTDGFGMHFNPTKDQLIFNYTVPSADDFTIHGGTNTSTNTEVLIIGKTGICTATQLFEGTTRVATTGKAIAMAMLFG